MRHYETELPSGYEPVYEIDAKNTKTGLLLNGASLVLLVLTVLPFLPTIAGRCPFVGARPERTIPVLGVFLLSMLVYLVLHELVHGAAYWLLTRRKLAFGITWSAAYCGVPDIYVYRTAGLIATAAPFVVFTVVLLPLALALRNDPLLYLPAVLLFALHVSGCVGDLYNIVLLLFRFRDPALLMRDTGPKQTFCLPKRD